MVLPTKKQEDYRVARNYEYVLGRYVLFIFGIATEDERCRNYRLGRKKSATKFVECPDERARKACSRNPYQEVARPVPQSDAGQKLRMFYRMYRQLGLRVSEIFCAD